MKVLLIAPLPPPVGGIASVTDNLVNFLKTTPKEIELIVYNNTHHFRPVTSESFLIRMFTGILNSLKTYWKVSKIIRKEVPDVLHLASSASLALFKDYLIIKAANRKRVPVVMHWHLGRIPSMKDKHNWEWRILKTVIQKSACSIVIDHKSLNTLVEEGFRQVVQISNPLALDIEKKAREFMGINRLRQKDRLIFVGHIIKSKGVVELMEACSQIDQISELIMIGPCQKETRDTLIKVAKNRDDGKWLCFTGQLNQDQVLEYMAQSPILVLPSYTEGFPMVIIEAMAMGCAVIATDVGEIPDILAINTRLPCGICIPVQNMERLKDAIDSLIRDQNTLETFSKRGVDRVLMNYTMEKIYKKYRTVWADVGKKGQLTK
jgi:glycosyltransferase involved in cell wall biosynthesis